MFFHFILTQITVYEKPGSNICAAFLTNNNTKIDSSITFRGVDYFLPAKSISILPDCKTVVYNTNTVWKETDGIFCPKYIVLNHKIERGKKKKKGWYTETGTWIQCSKKVGKSQRELTSSSDR